VCRPCAAVRVDDADPVPGRKRFFNQILAAHHGWRDELNPPGKSVVFGDGREMPVEAMAAMARIFDEEAVGHGVQVEFKITHTLEGSGFNH
jgi:hypothetical protein